MKIVYENIKDSTVVKIRKDVYIIGFRTLPTSKHQKKNLKNISVETER
jgi:hypothetical protein